MYIYHNIIINIVRSTLTQFEEKAKEKISLIIKDKLILLEKYLLQDNPKLQMLLSSSDNEYTNDIINFLFLLRTNQEISYNIIINNSNALYNPNLTTLYTDFLYEDYLSKDYISNEYLLLVYRILNKEINSNYIKVTEPITFLHHEPCGKMLLNLCRNPQVLNIFKYIFKPVFEETNKFNFLLSFNIDNLSTIVSKKIQFEDEKEPIIDEQTFFDVFITDIDREVIQKEIEKTNDKNMKDYLNQQIEFIIQEKKEDLFQSSVFLDLIYKFENSLELLQVYKNLMFKAMHIVHLLIKQMYDNIYMMPKGMRYICKIISILFKKRFKDIKQFELNAFISRFVFMKFFREFILSKNFFKVLKKQNYDISANIELLFNIICDFLSGHFERAECMPTLTIFNWFFIHEMPLVFDFYDKLIDLPLPDCIQNFIQNENKDINLFEYDFNKEEKEQLVKAYSFTYTQNHIFSMIEIINSNIKIFEEMKGWNDIKDVYNKLKNKFYKEQQKSFMNDYDTKQIFFSKTVIAYSNKLKNILSVINNDSSPVDIKDKIKNCLIEILSEIDMNKVPIKEEIKSVFDFINVISEYPSYPFVSISERTYFDIQFIKENYKAITKEDFIEIFKSIIEEIKDKMNTIDIDLVSDSNSLIYHNANKVSDALIKLTKSIKRDKKLGEMKIYIKKNILLFTTKKYKNIEKLMKKVISNDERTIPISYTSNPQTDTKNGFVISITDYLECIRNVGVSLYHIILILNALFSALKELIQVESVTFTYEDFKEIIFIKLYLLLFSSKETDKDAKYLMKCNAGADENLINNSIFGDKMSYCIRKIEKIDKVYSPEKKMKMFQKVKSIIEEYFIATKRDRTKEEMNIYKYIFLRAKLTKFESTIEYMKFYSEKKDETFNADIAKLTNILNSTLG